MRGTQREGNMRKDGGEQRELQAEGRRGWRGTKGEEGSKRQGAEGMTRGAEGDKVREKEAPPQAVVCPQNAQGGRTQPSTRPCRGNGNALPPLSALRCPEPSAEAAAELASGPHCAALNRAHGSPPPQALPLAACIPAHHPAPPLPLFPPPSAPSLRDSQVWASSLALLLVVSVEFQSFRAPGACEPLTDLGAWGDPA